MRREKLFSHHHPSVIYPKLTSPYEPMTMWGYRRPGNCLTKQKTRTRRTLCSFARQSKNLTKAERFRDYKTSHIIKLLSGQEEPKNNNADRDRSTRSQLTFMVQFKSSAFSWLVLNRPGQLSVAAILATKPMRRKNDRSAPCETRKVVGALNVPLWRARVSFC